MIAIYIILISCSWIAGFIMIPLRDRGIVHMAGWINLAFFWGPYVLCFFIMIAVLAYELWAEEHGKRNKRG